MTRCWSGWKGATVGDGPVRVVVIGLGAWGALAHLPALRAHPDAEVVAVVDPAPGRAAEVAARGGIATALTDAAGLWARPETFDAVVVATPTDTHAALVAPALALGKHVLCEKPLALDLTQARDLAVAAQGADAHSRSAGGPGIVARLGFMFRFSPALRRMRELIAGGYVGDVVAFQSHTMNGQFARPDAPLHWKMRRDRANGGVHVEYGAHALDLAAWLAAPLTRVVAHATTVTAERATPGGTAVETGGGTGVVDVDDIAGWLAELAGGAQASFQTSWSTLPVGGGGVRVYGTGGSLAWEPDPTLRASETLIGATLDAPEPATLLTYRARPRPAGDPARPLGISADYHEGLIASFLTDIRAGTVTGPTFADGLRAQAGLAAIGASLISGGWEPVS